MKIRTLFDSLLVLVIVTHAKGGLTSSRSPRTTLSPNDVLAPPVQTIYVPQKESSSKTDALLSAMSFTTAVLPYIGHLTSMFKSDEVEPSADPAQKLIVHANNVSRKIRSTENDSKIDSSSDSLVGIILSPLNVLWETANIILDVLAVTREQGLTDSQTYSYRARRDLVYKDDARSLYYGPDLASRYPTFKAHKYVSI